MCQETKTLHSSCGHNIPVRSYCAYYNDKRANKLYDFRLCPSFVVVQTNAEGRCEKYGYCIPVKTMADDEKKYGWVDKDAVKNTSSTASKSVEKPKDKPDVTMG